MKILLLNGFENKDSVAESVLASVRSEAVVKGTTLEWIYLAEKDIAYCQGCFNCWVKTPGICCINDDGRLIAEKMINCDFLIFVTPLTFGGYSAVLKKAADRMIPLLSPFFVKLKGEIHHRKRYPKYPSLIGIGITNEIDPDSEKIFRTLINCNAINSHSSQQGALVINKSWEKEKIQQEVKQFIQEFIQ